LILNQKQLKIGFDSRIKNNIKIKNNINIELILNQKQINNIIKIKSKYFLAEYFATKVKNLVKKFLADYSATK
jgi:hypothetical protein